MPDGNRRLLEKGALPFPEHYSKLRDWLQVHATGDNPQPKQLGLF